MKNSRQNSWLLSNSELFLHFTPVSSAAEPFLSQPLGQKVINFRNCLRAPTFDLYRNNLAEIFWSRNDNVKIEERSCGRRGHLNVLLELHSTSEDV